MPPTHVLRVPHAAGSAAPLLQALPARAPRCPPNRTCLPTSPSHQTPSLMEQHHLPNQTLWTSSDYGAPRLVPATPRSSRTHATAAELSSPADSVILTHHRDFSEPATLIHPRSDRQRLPRWTSSSQVTLPSRSRLTSPRREIQEVSLNLPNHISPPESHLVTLHRPIPQNMTPQEVSFHQQSYPAYRLTPPMSSEPYLTVASPIHLHRMHSSLQTSPHHEAEAVSKSPHNLRTVTSLPYGSPGTSKLSLTPNGNRYTPHPFQALPHSMMIRKPEPISWIKYPVEPHHIYPGPYAAVDVPFEDVNNNPSSFDVHKASKKGKLSLTWSPQKLKYHEKSRKCVRFASTWGPKHPGAVGEYATINPKKLTSRYVRPAIFRRSNLKELPRA